MKISRTQHEDVPVLHLYPCQSTKVVELETHMGVYVMEAILKLGKLKIYQTV